jgi:cytochrome b-561
LVVMFIIGVLLFYSTPGKVEETFLSLTAVASVVFAIVTFALMVKWATDSNTSTDTGFLGSPSLKSNLFAYHPYLMVCGFFVCQVLAILSWTVIPNHDLAKLLHLLLHSVAIVTLSYSLWTIVKYTYENKSPNLISLHSWIGVASVLVYLFNYLWGGMMATLTRCCPDSPLRKNYDLRYVHSLIGVGALLLTVGAIQTGIMDQLPYSSCYFLVSSSDVSTTYINYEKLPRSCKIGNGIGIAVIITASCLLLTVSLRGYQKNQGTGKASSDSSHH